MPHLHPLGDPESGSRSLSSEQFDGFTICRKAAQEWGRNGLRHTLNSILHSSDGAAFYISKSIPPARFTDAEVEAEINRISQNIGQRAKVLRSAGNPKGVIAYWGALTWTRSHVMAGLRENRPVLQGFLFDLLGNARRSAREGRPCTEFPAEVGTFGRRPELLADNYFHAVLEAGKSIGEKLRSKTGLTDDGAPLIHRVLCGMPPCSRSTH